MPNLAPRPRDFEVLSFDCYGTLIDWESGILAALQPVVARHELVSRSEEILEAYARAESAVEAGSYRPYREVLRRTLAGMAKDLGFAPRADELETLVEALPNWQPFPDTVRSLQALARAGHKLALISNIDEELFVPTAEQLGIPFDYVITADSVGAYKPAPAVFERALERFGLVPGSVLHAAQSRFHDIVPARRLGLQTVHVTRDAGRGDASATPRVEPQDADLARADFTVANLSQLVELLAPTLT